MGTKFKITSELECALQNMSWLSLLGWALLTSNDIPRPDTTWSGSRGVYICTPQPLVSEWIWRLTEQVWSASESWSVHRSNEKMVAEKICGKPRKQSIGRDFLYNILVVILTLVDTLPLLLPALFLTPPPPNLYTPLSYSHLFLIRILLKVRTFKKWSNRNYELAAGPISSRKYLCQK